MFNYQGQVAIVTGGTRGIGRGITENFLRSGAKVVATYASNDLAAQAFKNELEDLGENLILKKFDVSDTAQVQAFWNDITNEVEKIDILVNNSGIRKDNMAALMPDEDWDKVLNINLSGSFYMTKRAITHFMSNRYGRIVNMSSVGGTLGLAGQSNYAASKAAQIAMSKAISKEVARKGITINNVCPGFIETELIADLPADQVKDYKKQVPMRRFGSVDDVANAVMFLASKEASYITGASLEVTGGL